MRERSADRVPRPLADAPVALLVTNSESIARAWLGELVVSQPLAASAELPVAQIARDGPALCANVAESLGDDAALERLSGARRLLRELGASDPTAIVWAVEALRRVLWARLLDELDRPTVELASELADRLAHVCATLLDCGLYRPPAPPEPDEFRASAPGHRPERRLPDESAPVAAPGPGLAEPPPVRETHRPPPADAPWLAAIAQRLDARQPNDEPFAVLLVEVAGRERLIAAAEAGAAEAIGRSERALLSRLRSGNRLLREEAGRWWVLLADTDRSAAESAAEWFGSPPPGREDHRGVPLRFAVGIAVCPSDGEDAVTLAECAEDSLLAALARG